MKANESSYSKRGGIFGTITALVTAIAIVSAVLLCVYIDDTAAETYDENGIDVMILMYHNIIADGAKPSKYENQLLYAKRGYEISSGERISLNRQQRPHSLYAGEKDSSR